MCHPHSKGDSSYFSGASLQCINIHHEHTNPLGDYYNPTNLTFEEALSQGWSIVVQLIAGFIPDDRSYFGQSHCVVLEKIEDEFYVFRNSQGGHESQILIPRGRVPYLQYLQFEVASQTGSEIGIEMRIENGIGFESRFRTLIKDAERNY